MAIYAAVRDAIAFARPRGQSVAKVGSHAAAILAPADQPPNQVAKIVFSGIVPGKVITIALSEMMASISASALQLVSPLPPIMDIKAHFLVRS